VQIGIWDDITIEVVNGREISSLRCWTDANLSSETGYLQLSGEVRGIQTDLLEITLTDGATVLRCETVELQHFNQQGLTWEDLPVRLWWPNGQGKQPLYTLTCRLVDSQSRGHDQVVYRLGFKHIQWQSCQDAPAGAYPWLCVVNGRPVFLQGVNWTPIRPNFADVAEADYRHRLETYRRLGCNVLRVWGGAFLEKELFYELCDELGILVWQDFPLSSSGLGSLPPDDENSSDDLVHIAALYVRRRQHHVSVLCWCGGNELHELAEGRAVPLSLDHPLLARFGKVVAELDPTHRFIPTTPSGPTYCANSREGLHWDVHGPWKVQCSLAEWEQYWQNDDALFRSELGSPGASSAELIQAYAGNLDGFPVSLDNPLWCRQHWWLEGSVFIGEKGREPANLKEYVTWSQERQALTLSIAVGACKRRFPRCGGVILWMGHDCFPCCANTSIIDFEGNAKPAAEAVGQIFGEPADICNDHYICVDKGKVSR
jgi:beta-mannosidase